MIKVSDIVKVYDKRNKPALDGVSFNLADTGLVFVVGKSGSGKSTLLNILGGLDTATGGAVEVDGNLLSQLSQRRLDEYRNSYTGFIYQDFCLFENMTVRENIRLSLELQGKQNDAEIEKIAKRVELESFLERPVRKLSGGQKQRVAIARALIKSPRLILADEPTGNLDSKTSEQILKLLVEISKESLVVIVSHNLSDALKYADRIIELADGRIVTDEESNGTNNELAFSDDAIFLPNGVALTDEEIRKVNSLKGEREIRQQPPRFKPTEQPKAVDRRLELVSHSMKPKSVLSLFLKFAFGRKFAFLITTVILAAVMITLALCQGFAAYDGRQTIKGIFEKSNDPALILRKGYVSDNVFKELSKDKLGRITEEEIASFYEDGYEGKIFRLNNATTGRDGNPLEHSLSVNLSDNFKNFYASVNLGLLECDEEFLTELFGKDGEIKVLAGTLDYTQKPQGMILTDYMADSLIYHQPELAGTPQNPYSTLVERKTVNTRFSVLAVIDTGYKERYKELLDLYGEYFNSENEIQRDELMQMITEREDYLAFYNELTGYLAITYSTNPNYRRDAIEYMNNSRYISYFTSLDVYDESGRLIGENINLQSDNESWVNTLNERDYYPLNASNEIYINYVLYNDLFGTNLTQEDTSAFVPRTVTFVNYDACRGTDETPLYTRSYKIVGVTHTTAIHSLLSDEEFKFVRQYDVYTSALYFTDMDFCTDIYYQTEDTAFYMGNQNIEAIYQVIDVVEIFKEYFNLIGFIIAAIGFLLLVSYHAGNLKSRRYEIGVLRSMGCKTRTIGSIFFLQSLLIGAITALLFLIGTVTLTDTVNGILIESFKTYINSPAIAYIDAVKILEFSALSALVDIALAIAISVLSAVVPISTIRKINPISILRARE